VLEFLIKIDCITDFPTCRYSIKAPIEMVAPQRPYSSSWSTTLLANELGQGEYRGGALQIDFLLTVSKWDETSVIGSVYYFIVRSQIL